MSRLSLYFHTIRHLRPVQLAGRIWFRSYRPPIDTSAPPPRRARTGAYIEPVLARPRFVDKDVFRFAGVEGRLTGTSDWQNPKVAKLWLYNLHYFDDLNSRHSVCSGEWHRELLQRWVAENPPGRGVGWEPYPVSRRIVNWVKWALRGGGLPPACQASLAVQARWLSRRLEYHILGNHLLANGKALIHAGLYFDGPEAEAWCRRGFDIVERQLRAQVLSDGGHFELSTMYHATVLDDLLDIINLLRAHGRVESAEWRLTVAAMIRWLGAMTHPDGELAFFNDAAFAVAPSLAELVCYSARLDIPVPARDEAPLISLDGSGYVRASAGPAYLICDCGDIGPDYLPGHAHADSLSFELSVNGRRIFVNGGTSLYGTGPERQRQRGTAAHNTLGVNGQDSSEVWGGFRVARRARGRLEAARSSATSIVIEASHDGYRRLPGSNEHRRRWVLNERSLVIEDEVTGTFEGATAYFHVHPEVEATPLSETEVTLRVPGSRLLRFSIEQAPGLALRRGTWNPEFGVAVPNTCIVVQLATGLLRTTIRWLEDP